MLPREPRCSHVIGQPQRAGHGLVHAHEVRVRRDRQLAVRVRARPQHVAPEVQRHGNGAGSQQRLDLRARNAHGAVARRLARLTGPRRRRHRGTCTR